MLLYTWWSCIHLSSIRLFSVALILHRITGIMETVPGDSGHKVENTCLWWHPNPHLRQFIDANQPTMHVFWTEGGNPWSTRRAYKLHTPTQELWESNPPPQRHKTNVQTTKPPCLPQTRHHDAIPLLTFVHLVRLWIHCISDQDKAIIEDKWMYQHGRFKT